MPEILVGSYNVHHCVGNDGRRDVERVARVVATLGADAIALQEVGCAPRPGEEVSQIDAIAALTGLRPIQLATVARRDGIFGNAVLTSLPVQAVRTMDLSVKPFEPRGALDVELGADGRPLRIIATHLGLRPSERRHQVRRLLETVSHDDRSITVLLGDINEWFVHGRPLRWLHARFGRGAQARSWPAGWPLFALDRVWVHPRRALDHFQAVRSPEARVASDHLPVVARLSW